jgi:hypothetical protein
MKSFKKLAALLIFVGVGLFSSVVYGSDSVAVTSNVTVETVVKDDKKVEVVVSEDKYVRITQPTKVNTSTFESKMNIMGETKQGTDIIIEVYNTKIDKTSTDLPKASAVYTLSTVGVTETFNQLIELLEGENKIVLSYTNEKDKKDKADMIFFITRESEETKEKLKTFIVYPSAQDKEADLTTTVKSDSLK